LLKQNILEVLIKAPMQTGAHGPADESRSLYVACDLIREQSDSMAINEKSDQEEIGRYAHEAANRGLLKLGSAAEHEERQKVMQESAPYLTLGAQMAGSIAAFFGLGYWLDHHFATSFWIPTLTGVGAAASLTYFIIVVVRLGNKQSK
jgi:hypothetical protein